MAQGITTTPDGEPEDRDQTYRAALGALIAARTRFMVGGTYAFERHTGIIRQTKDIDLFVLPEDCGGVLSVLGAAGYGTELTDPVWLAKAFRQGYHLDIVFNSGNGLCPVDEDWFAHAPQAEVLGLRVMLCPAEETIWQKVFIMERERYDGADVMHLILKRGPELDWARLLQRMDCHWEVLLSHLLLFEFCYPGEAHAVPRWVVANLLARLDSRCRPDGAADRLCQGTLLSRYQYRFDLEQWHYRDGRTLAPRVDAA